MDAPAEHISLYENLEELEREIHGYQEFLGEVTLTYDRCGEGCMQKREGRKIDPDHLLELYQSHEFDDKFIEQKVSAASIIQASGVRQITRRCQEMLSDRRDRRQNLLEQRDLLEEKTAFERHPKKDYVPDI